MEVVGGGIDAVVEINLVEMIDGQVSGRPGENLIGQINSLSDLPGDIKDWSHQIRIFGNWGAHPDKDQLKNVERDDVLEVHDFFSKFLVYTFIMPARVKASRERREARSAGTTQLTDTE